MAQITEDLARDALARCERGQHPPLTAWETQQLIYAWLERERMRRALHEIAEEWAGAECGEPVHAQEAYAIGLAKRMYTLAVEGLTPNAELTGRPRPSNRSAGALLRLRLNRQLCSTAASEETMDEGNGPNPYFEGRHEGESEELRTLRLALVKERDELRADLKKHKAHIRLTNDIITNQCIAMQSGH